LAKRRSTIITAILLLSIVSLIIIIYRTTGQGNGVVDRLPVMSRIAAVFRRFPFAVAASVIGTTAGLMLVGNQESPSTWKKLLATALLALPLLISS